MQTFIINYLVTPSNGNRILYFNSSLIKWKILNKQIEQFLLPIKVAWKSLWMSSALELLKTPIRFQYIQSVNSRAGVVNIGNIHIQEQTRWAQLVVGARRDIFEGVMWWSSPRRPRWLWSIWASGRMRENTPTKGTRELLRQREQKAEALACQRDWRGTLCTPSPESWNRPGRTQGSSQLRQTSDMGYRVCTLCSIRKENTEGFNKVSLVAVGDWIVRERKLKQRD